MQQHFGQYQSMLYFASFADVLFSMRTALNELGLFQLSWLF